MIRLGSSGNLECDELRMEMTVSWMPPDRQFASSLPAEGDHLDIMLAEVIRFVIVMDHEVSQIP